MDHAGRAPLHGAAAVEVHLWSHKRRARLEAEILSRARIAEEAELGEAIEIFERPVVRPASDVHVAVVVEQPVVDEINREVARRENPGTGRDHRSEIDEIGARHLGTCILQRVRAHVDHAARVVGQVGAAAEVQELSRPETGIARVGERAEVFQDVGRDVFLHQSADEIDAGIAGDDGTARAGQHARVPVDQPAEVIRAAQRLQRAVEPEDRVAGEGRVAPERQALSAEQVHGLRAGHTACANGEIADRRRDIDGHGVSPVRDDDRIVRRAGHAIRRPVGRHGPVTTKDVGPLNRAVELKHRQCGRGVGRAAEAVRDHHRVESGVGRGGGGDGIARVGRAGEIRAVKAPLVADRRRARNAHKEVHRVRRPHDLIAWEGSDLQRRVGQANHGQDQIGAAVISLERGARRRIDRRERAGARREGHDDELVANLRHVVVPPTDVHRAVERGGAGQAKLVVARARAVGRAQFEVQFAGGSVGEACARDEAGRGAGVQRAVVVKRPRDRAAARERAGFDAQVGTQVKVAAEEAAAVGLHKRPADGEAAAVVVERAAVGDGGARPRRDAAAGIFRERAEVQQRGRGSRAAPNQRGIVGHRERAVVDERRAALAGDVHAAPRRAAIVDDAAPRRHSQIAQRLGGVARDVQRAGHGHGVARRTRGVERAPEPVEFVEREIRTAQIAVGQVVVLPETGRFNCQVPAD